MSIEYTLYKDDDPEKEIIFTTSLSNTSHAVWQDAVGLAMLRSNGDETISTLVHTTIHDKERQCFGIDWLEGYFDYIGDDAPVSPLLAELLTHAETNGNHLVYV